MKYLFEQIERCEMCGDNTQNHKVLGQRLNKSQGLSPKKKEGISVTVKKCTNCGLIYASPMPIPEDIQDHYGIPPEQYWDVAFIEDKSYFLRQVKLTQPLLNGVQKVKALDIGTGTGTAMKTMEREGWEAYGIEPSKPFYERMISKGGISPDRLKLGMVEDVDYPDNYFDFVTYAAVFEHIYHPAKSLEKVLNWVKPGGIVHIEVPSADHLIPKIINFYYRMRGTNYVTHISPMHEPFHLYEFTLKSFEALSKRLGFEIVKHVYDVCAIDFVPKPLHPPFRWYMEKTNTGMQLQVWIRKV